MKDQEEDNKKESVLPEVTPVIQDYLKAVFKLTSHGGKATTSGLSEELGVSMSSVSEMIKKLSEMEFVDLAPYRGVQLTRKGEAAAKQVIRHHRLVELFLHKIAGMPWDKVDAEADRLEHFISEDLEQLIDEKLDRPTFDPHGDPIPTREGLIDETDLERLSEIAEGRHVVVSRVSDGDPAHLRYLGELGLVPGAKVAVLRKEPFGGPITVQTDLGDRAIGLNIASEIFVSPVQVA